MGTAITRDIKAQRAAIQEEILSRNIQCWTFEESNRLERSARREYFEHSYQHGRRRDPDNCAACALQAGTGKNWDGPNYAGWLRVYIEAGIRPNAKAALKEIERARTENPRYFDAILRDIRTYRPRFIYPEGWDDNAKADAGEKF
jgi:hypothetical protein